MRFLLLALMSICLCACVTAPPSTRNDLCVVFQEKDGWYKEAKTAQDRWDTSIPVLMATMAQESSFVADARPPRHYYLGFIPGPRPSDAYGYPQAKDDIWSSYRHQAGSFGASRDNFGDAVDFVGWYYHQAYQRDGIKRDDAYNLYLSYHEGLQAYARHTAVPKPWQQQAQAVNHRAQQYAAQLKTCVDALEKAASSWF